METYIKIMLTPEQIAQIDAARINCGPLDPVSSFGDKPIQVDLVGDSGTTFFWYGVTDEIFTLIPVTNQPINNQNKPPIQPKASIKTNGCRPEGKYRTCPNMNDTGWRSNYKRLI